MIDISKWQEPIDFMDKVSDYSYTLQRVIMRKHNDFLVGTKEINLKGILYYLYDFEKGEGVIMSESDR